MRARRHFQPSLDSLPMRLAPGAVSVIAIVTPLCPLAGAGTPAATVSPNDTISGSNNSGSSDSPTTPVGSFLALAATASC